MQQCNDFITRGVWTVDWASGGLKSTIIW